MTLIKPDEKGYIFYEKPVYPDVPYAEYTARISKAQRLMAENDIDCMVLWSRKNIRYFFGYQNTHWEITSIQPAVAIITVEGEPIFIVPDFFRGTTECLCWTRNIWGQKDPHQPKSERELPISTSSAGPLSTAWSPPKQEYSEMI